MQAAMISNRLVSLVTLMVAFVVIDVAFASDLLNEIKEPTAQTPAE